jgi:hypothetical protein
MMSSMSTSRTHLQKAQEALHILGPPHR